MVRVSSVPPRVWTQAWALLAIGLLTSQASLLLVVRSVGSLIAYTEVLDFGYLVLLIIAASLATLNALNSHGAIRLFWSFLAVGCGIWALNAWSWFYYLAIKGSQRPDFLIAGFPLYLHLVFFIAAAVSRPHLTLSRQKPYRITLNLLLLVFVLAVAYTLVIFPTWYMRYDSAYILRIQFLYCVENLLLLAVLGAVTIEARRPWKGIYWHLLGASVLYALGSVIASLVIASGRMSAGWYSLPYTAAAYWFIWVMLKGREEASQLAETVQVDTFNPRYASTLAMLSLMAIPLVGVWELFRPGQPYAIRVVRLLIIFLSLLVLAITAFIIERLARRELSSDVDLARDRLRMAMASSKSVGWEWDLVTGRDLWFGDLQTMFGIASDVFSGRPEDFHRYVHPDDRQRVAKAVMDARTKREPYEAEFRVVRQDGTVRWVAARGAFYYAKNGNPERMLGMAGDITERREAEDALKKSEEKFSKAFRESPMAVTLTSAKDHRYLDVNETFEQITGWRRDEVIGRTPFDLNIWESPAERIELTKRILSDGTVRNLELRFLCKDGTQRVGLGSAERIDIRDETCIISVIADITDRKRIQEQLQESEQRLRGIVDSAMDAIVAVDEEQRIVLFNTAAEKIFGCTAEDAVGTTIERFIPQRFRANHKAQILSAGQSATTSRDMGVLGTLWAVRASGEEFPIEASISYVQTENKKLFTIIIRDVTERRHMEELQRESEERFHLAVQAGKMYAYEWDINSDLIMRSPECADVLGSSDPVEITGSEFMDQIHPDDRTRMGEFRTAITPTNPTSQISYRFLRPEGTVLWLERRARGLFDDHGKLLRVVGVVVDITERKHAEDALSASEERYRHLVDASNDWVWEVDAEWVYTYTGPQCREILGYEPQELIGKTPFDLMSPEESRRVAATFSAFSDERRTFRGSENTSLHKDGHPVVKETSGTPMTDLQGNFIGYRGMDRDITERKRAEHAVRESEQRFRLVANKAPVMIWVSEPDKLCTYFNQPWLEFTGRPLEAELGNGWAEGVHPEDLNSCLDTYVQAFDRRESFQMEYRLRRKDGEYRWILDIGVPRVNPDQSFAGYIGSCIDVTDHKLAEEALSSVSRRLIEAQEDERKWIARELHDDINQRIALLSVELERWSQQLPQSAVDIHNHIRHASERLSNLAKDVQALSHRLHSSKLEYLGIAATAKSFCKEFADQQKVEVEFSHSDIPRNLTYEVELCLFRVLQEALQNALKHSGARRFHVDLRATAQDISLSVSDQGAGFDQHDAVNLQGLGLVSMRERLQLVKGEFSIDSERGRGTTIRARVPCLTDTFRLRVAV